MTENGFFDGWCIPNGVIKHQKVPPNNISKMGFRLNYNGMETLLIYKYEYRYMFIEPILQ